MELYDVPWYCLTSAAILFLLGLACLLLWCLRFRNRKLIDSPELDKLVSKKPKPVKRRRGVTSVAEEGRLEEVGPHPRGPIEWPESEAFPLDSSSSLSTQSSPEAEPEVELPSLPSSPTSCCSDECVHGPQDQRRLRQLYDMGLLKFQY